MRKNSFTIINRFRLLVFSVLFALPAQAFSESGMRSVCVRKSDDLSKVLAAENTTFIIRHQHDLSKYPNGVVIGKNSALVFEKGCFKSGTIYFNDTKVNAKVRAIFLNNRYKGLLDVEQAYPEWFGAVGDGKTDDTRPIQDAMDVARVVKGYGERVYAVRADSPYKHCLTVKRDSLTMSIHLRDINKYTTSDYRGRGIIFVDNKNAFSFKGNIISVNDKLPVSAKTGMTLENGRAGIVCYGDCGDCQSILPVRIFIAAFITGRL